MKHNPRFPQIVNLIIGIVISVVLLLVAHNYSGQFFVSYLFFLIGGLCSFLATRNWGRGHQNSFPIKTAFVVIAYLYWLLTATIVFWIAVIGNLHLRLLLLAELVPMGIATLIIYLFQSVSAKYETEDQNVRTRDTEIGEIAQRISIIYEKSAGLHKPINDEVQKRITTLKDAFRYSEVFSPHYTVEMLQAIYDGLTVIENELDAVLSIQPEEVSRLEGTVSHLITAIKNNDEACKASKR